MDNLEDNVWPWEAEADSVELVVLAAQFWHAAYALCYQAEPLVPQYMFEPKSHLLAHASELALKHYLSNRLSRSQFDKLTGSNGKHNLKALLSAAITNGLALDLREATPVVQYHEVHLKHVFRYGGGGSIMTADPMLALPRVAGLIDRCAGGLAVLRGGRSGAAPIFSYPAPPPIRVPATVSLLEDMAAGFKEQSDKLFAQSMNIRSGKWRRGGED